MGVITLDNAARRNVHSQPMVTEIVAALTAIGQQRLRAVVLRAAPGSPVWSAGHAVDEMPESGRDPLGWDDPLRQFIREIEICREPVVALVEGSVWGGVRGGACGAVFVCDLVVAAPGATFALTPARLGVPYNISGMLTLLNASNMRIAKEMAFTAQPIGAERAERAERLGIINDVVTAAELEAFCMAMAQDIARHAPLSGSVMKEKWRILAGAHPMTPQGVERVQGLRRLVCDSADHREGIRAVKEKRRPVLRGE